MSKKIEASRDREAQRRWIDALVPGSHFWSHYAWTRDDGTIYVWHRTLWRVNPVELRAINGQCFFQRANRWATHNRNTDSARLVWIESTERFPPDRVNDSMWFELIDEFETDRIAMMDLHAPERLNHYLHATYPTGRPPYDPETDSPASHP